MQGQFFFAKPRFTGLTNYVIRHNSKYSNMITSVDTLPMLTQMPCKPCKPISMVLVQVLYTEGGTVHVICQLYSGMLYNSKKKTIHYFLIISMLFVINPIVSVSYAVLVHSMCSIFILEAKILPKLGVAQFFFHSLRLD